MIGPLPGDIFHQGHVLNNTYEIEGVLGRGGTGEVYRARNQITGRVVAVKALNRAFSANDAYVELMKREEEMRAIHSDAIVRYTDCSRSAEGHVYLVMDYVDGTPLSDWLERGGAEPRDLMVVARRVTEGLVTAHERGIIHRDLSPDNIILRGGDPAQAVIIDFGIAKDANAGARTIVGDGFAGKYEYAAPEQLHGRAEPRSDLYALGALLLATFRGRIPEASSLGAIIERKQRPLDTDGVPEPLRGLIDTLTQPDPARRPPSATVVGTEIDALLKGPATPPSRSAATRGRRRWPFAVAAVVLFGLLAGLGWFLFLQPLPVARPYVLVAERTGDGGARLSGNVPDKVAREQVLAAFAAAAGTMAPLNALTSASGAPVLDWGGAVAALLASVAPLEEWRLDISDQSASLVGTAPDATVRATVTASFTDVATGAGLTPFARIATGPLHLSPAAVEVALRPFADCGPLMVAARGGSYPMGEAVAVTGDVATVETQARLATALAGAIGDRAPRLDVEVLNPEICGLLTTSPGIVAGDIEVALGYGDRAEENPTGVYSPGDTPVIDVTMPSVPDNGHLWVALADVSGMLYNLLPTLARPEAAIRNLGTVSDGTRRIRITYGAAEARVDPARRPSFTVAPPFGKSILMAIHTDEPLFLPPRPPEESIPSFAEDFGALLRAGQVRILGLSKRVIETRE